MKKTLELLSTALIIIGFILSCYALVYMYKFDKAYEAGYRDCFQRIKSSMNDGIRDGRTFYLADADRNLDMQIIFYPRRDGGVLLQK